MGAWIETPRLLDERRASKVAPHVGAWIETLYKLLDLSDKDVAPHVGAWIETIVLYANGSAGKSPPTWGRGLKQSRLAVFLAT